MAEPEFKSFNDPALRAAVRGVWANERAPRELRKQIAALCTTQTRNAPDPLIFRLRSALYGLAAAAVFLLAVGLAFENWTGGGRRPLRAPRTIALPTALATDLFAQHDQDVKSKNHQAPGVAKIDFKLIGRQLQDRLNFPVLSADLPKPGWKFKGAQVCTVSKIVTAHLVFEYQGREYISLFSMPASSVSGSAPGCDYAQTDNRHLMAGFATQAGFYCVVATSTDESITIEEVRTIRDELRPLMNDVPASPNGQLATILPR